MTSIGGKRRQNVISNESAAGTYDLHPATDNAERVGAGMTWRRRLAARGNGSGALKRQEGSMIYRVFAFVVDERRIINQWKPAIG